MNASISQVPPQELSARLTQSEASGGSPLLLDVRTPMEHSEMHLPGCRLVPLDSLDAAALAAEAGSDREVVIICRSGNRAGRAAEKLAAAGMNRISVLQGGLQAWSAAGLPVNRGKSVISLERQVRIAAGILVLTGFCLGTWVHPGFFGICGFMGAGLIFAGVTDWCGMGMLLARAPWNQISPPAVQQASCCQVRPAR